MKFGLPFQNLNLLKYPAGNLLQGWGENCALYTEAFKRMGSPSKCHNGIDCFTFENDEVLAVNDGIVLKADFGETTHGNGVWLLSNPYDGDDGKRRCMLTVYFHMNSLTVKTGQIVKQGEVLGFEGNTGFIVAGSTPYWGNAPVHHGVHLHFGTYPLVAGQNGYIINGESFVKEFPNNDENGAVDPIPFLRPDISDYLKEITLLQKMVELIKKLFK